MSLELKTGTICVADGHVVEIDGPDSIRDMRVRDVATGAFRIIPISRIEPLPKPMSRPEAGFIPAEEWKRCTALAKDLAPFADQGRVSRADLMKIADRHGISLRQLQRVRTRLADDGRASAVARSKGGRPAGLNLLSPEVNHLIHRAIQKEYCRRERPSKQHTVEHIRSLARRLKLPVPSRNAILRRIKEHEGWEADLARLGAKAAKQKSEPRPGGLRVLSPLDLVQIDHSPADVMVLSDDRLRVIGRPWITVAIDVATRSVLGLYVAMHAPSSVSVSLCIEHAVLPKLENQDAPGIWPMYGKPKRILVDNGKDFRAYALARGCQEHGIELTFRPVATPHYGAHIERLIGTLMGLVHLLPGTTFSNPKERGDYDSEGKARLTLSEFREWLVNKVCRYYHAQTHRALGVPPRVAWERGLTGDNGQSKLPALLQRPLEFRLDFLPFVYRKVRRTGIELANSRYWHEDLTPLLRHHEDVLVRYHPQEPGHVWVRRKDGVLVEAKAIAGRALGAPSARLQIDEQTAKAMESLIDEGFAVSDSILAEAQKETRAARRKSPRTAKPAPKSAAHEPETLESRYPKPPVNSGRPAVVEIWSTP